MLCGPSGPGRRDFLWGLPRDSDFLCAPIRQGSRLRTACRSTTSKASAFSSGWKSDSTRSMPFARAKRHGSIRQVLRLLHQRLGAECFSVYPYQIGQDNEEAMDSGAFWFYRKLGFRPVRRELERLAEREEKKIAGSLATGRRPKLAPPGGGPRGLRVARSRAGRMGPLSNASHRNRAAEIDGAGIWRNSERMKKAAQAKLSRDLGVVPARWPAAEQRAFEDFSLVLSLVPDLRRWQSVEKSGLVGTIRAKSSLSDDRYAALLASSSR